MTGVNSNIMYADLVLYRSSPCASRWQHKSVQFPYLTSLQCSPLYTACMLL